MSVYSRNDRRSGKERRSRKERRSNIERRKFDDSAYRPFPGEPPEVSVTKGTMTISILPDWGQIENMRVKTRDFLASRGLSVARIDAFTMVSSELVENAMKYGCFDSLESGINLVLRVSGKHIIVEVIHPVSANALQHLHRLDKTIQWIRGYQDPFQAYLEKLKEVAKRPMNDSESGLGLVRIAYEGKSILDFFLSEDDALNVSAIAAIEDSLWR
jgi:hypothetical protein